MSEQEQIDVAFRVIADHLRTTSFAIADGILPSNDRRNYVIRRILRRAVKFGRTLGFGESEPFLSKLVPTLAEQMGDIFPELRSRQAKIAETLDQEEASFNQTLDRGIRLFEEALGTWRQRLLRETSPSLSRILLASR
ncbi:MAG: alanine--tRNA ligase-related protein [Verrucomicrobiales bacterium]